MMKTLSFDRDGYWTLSKRLQLGCLEELTGGGKKPLMRTSLLALLEGVDVVARRRRKRAHRARLTDGGSRLRILTFFDAGRFMTLPVAPNGAPKSVYRYTVRIASMEAVSCRVPRL